MTTTSVKVDESHNPLRYFEWNDRDHCPHWKRPPSEGFATLRVRTHKENSYLDIHTAEFGEKFSKETMVCLSKEDGRKFYEWLKTIYEA